MSVFLLLVNLYSRIHKGVNDIHNQVADDNHGSYKYGQSQCHRIVTVSDRIYKIPASPGILNTFSIIKVPVISAATIGPT